MLYIKEEFNLENFEAWGGAVSRLEEIKELDITYIIQAYIEEIFMDKEDVTATDINDLIWFDMDDIIENYKEDEDED
ncbi:hypothetical protein AVP_15 [Aerococcus phage vB_AviM_AVP]|nr:hypothetical protein AVP_15 [Aerococcus phage vB_AviM_AVP]